MKDNKAVKKTVDEDEDEDEDDHKGVAMMSKRHIQNIQVDPNLQYLPKMKKLGGSVMDSNTYLKRH